MKSPMVESLDYITDKNRYTDLMVLQSGAGYYIGTLYNNPDGYQEPGSRDSDYFATQEEAEQALGAMSALGPDMAKQRFRQHP